MFNQENIKKIYEQNYKAYMDLININTSAAKDYLALQSGLIEDFVKQTNDSLITMGAIKNPQDLEKFMKDSKSKMEAKMFEQNNKYTTLLQNHQKQITEVLEKLFQDSTELGVNLSKNNLKS